MMAGKVKVDRININTTAGVRIMDKVMRRNKMNIGTMTGDRGKGGAGFAPGFTIVELLVAMSILIFISVALLQTAIINIEYNTKNAIRDEATRVGGENLDKMRNFNSTTNSIIDEFHGTTGEQTRIIRNMNWKYIVTNSVTAMSGGGDVYSYNLMVRVKWTWKGKDSFRTVYTVRPE